MRRVALLAGGWAGEKAVAASGGRAAGRGVVLAAALLVAMAGAAGTPGGASPVPRSGPAVTGSPTAAATPDAPEAPAPHPAVQLALDTTEGAEWIEGESHEVTWHAEGADTVRVTARGERTPLGHQPRGQFEIVIADGAPAFGTAMWQVPWIDALQFTVAVTGYDSSGEVVAAAGRVVAFRPSVLAARGADGIYLDLHQRVHQRLYVQRNGRLTHAYLSSASEAYRWLPPSQHPGTPHDHAGVFRVRSKTRLHISRLFSARMPWSMNYVGGHYIHATSSNFYPLLGQPASHGCNRLTEEDARELYAITPVGTRVEVIGPGG